ncbi:hypothetical protein M0G74_15070 [Microbulbifer sp. CAU 1566]|uniref:hypothetical protein n=1 Tax=Microbulbifer sp. CAU 1566 TaxID=2933269 RepID=UPI00200307AC|nr:hypothetical protein [Microbulbifer sp. CAU 1566]MCK7598599.1 hypothetical protein [Microbulbifer sp. CAU 1566]
MKRNSLPGCKLLALAILTFNLAACGGGGGGGSEAPTPSPQPTPQSTPQPTPDPEPTPDASGVIVDSPIANLHYLTTSGIEGTTDSSGAFQYVTSDNIVFSLGSLQFPAIPAASAVTPLELFAVKDIRDPRVVNFIRLVQSLDSDGDIDERIQLRENTAEVINSSGLSLEHFNQDPLIFETSNEITAVLSGAGLGQLVDLESAVTHFSATMQNSTDIDSDLDGTSNADDTDDDNDGIEDAHDAQPYDQEIGGDADLDGVDNIEDADDDNDGVLDSEDAFPYDASEQLDSDGDGVGNNVDSDDDNDGVADGRDSAPLDPEVSGDFDDDGIDDLHDSDDDNDGAQDAVDAFPYDETEQHDTDDDGIGDNADPDDDNDGVEDQYDQYPKSDLASGDLDGDGEDNIADSDDDGDGVEDTEDAFPFDAAETEDWDADGIGDNGDPDDDNDGVVDLYDASPNDPEHSGDYDSDGLDSIVDPDDDNDGIEDESDQFPFDETESRDFDGDGIGNNADPDDDNDGTPDFLDEAPLDPQVTGDTDGDGIDNLFDPDDDNDGYVDSQDSFPHDASEHRDFDGDTIGDNADVDDDNDNLLDTEDRLSIVGNKSVYLQEEPIVLKVEGFDPNFEKALDEDGWHVQFNTYDVNKPERALSEYFAEGVYNANYDLSTGTWRIEYWAPRVPGSYKTEVVLYCSMSPSYCEDTFPYLQVEQFIYFESTCEEPPCTYELDAPTGSYVTNTYEHSSAPNFTQRANGELVAVYNELENTYLVHSVDQGATWSAVAVVPEKISENAALIENSAGNLLLLGRCSYRELCIYETKDGSSWLKTELTGLTNFAGCDQDSCDIYDIQLDSMIESLGGRYVVSYSVHDSSSAESRSKVYVTTSGDFQSWTDPVLVSEGDDHNIASQLMQSSDESYYLSYISYSSGGVVVAESTDLLSWNNRYSLGSYGGYSYSFLVEVSGFKHLFFSSWDGLYHSELSAAGFSAITTIADDIKYPGAMLLLQSGNIGLIYDKDLNNQHDVFYHELAVPDL